MARILVWADFAWQQIDGIDIMARRLLPALEARGHALEVITSKTGEGASEEIQNGIPIHRIDTLLEQSARSVDVTAAGITRVRQIVESFQPELMFLMQPMTLLVFYLASQHRARQMSIYALRNSLERIWEPTHLVGQVIRGTDFVVSCSEVVLQVARDRMPEITPRSLAIRNALPMPDLLPEPLPWSQPRLLCLGALTARKSIDTAVGAFARVARRFPHARLVVSGDGPMRGELVALAAALDVSDRVEFTGWVSPENVPAAINQATAVIIPSLQEGLPQVAIQAAQMGRPILGTAVDGLLEVVADGETGFLVEPRDEAALAEAMTRLLDDQEVGTMMGQAARSRAEMLFDWNDHVQQFDELFRRLAVDERQ